MMKKIALLVLLVGLAAPSAFAQKTVIVIREFNSIASDQVYLDMLSATGVLTASGSVSGLGYNTVSFDDDDYTQDTFTSADGDLILILESVGSGSLNDTHADDLLPIVSTEAFISDNRTGRCSLYFTDTATSGPNYVEDTGITIIDNTHPITSIFPAGKLEIWTAPSRLHEMPGNIAPEVTLLANDGDASPEICFAVADEGTNLPGAPAGISPTPAKRAFLNVYRPSYLNATADGVFLFQRLIQWAIGDPVVAGLPPEPTPTPLPSSGIREWRLYQ